MRSAWLTRLYLLTPEMAAVITTAAQARARPGMATLPAFARRDAGQQDFGEHFEALAADMHTLSETGRRGAGEYYDMVRGGLPGPASERWKHSCQRIHQRRNPDPRQRR